MFHYSERIKPSLSICQSRISQGIASFVASGFREIIPCGLIDQTVGKLEDVIPGLTVEEVQPIVKEMIAKRFSLIWED